MSSATRDFTLEVMSMSQQVATATLLVDVEAARLGIATVVLPKTRVGESYSVQLVADGGAAPLIWSATGLPAGLACSPEGLISGTPTVYGRFAVVVQVVDSGTDA